MSCCWKGQLWTGAWREMAHEEWVTVLAGSGKEGSVLLKETSMMDWGEGGKGGKAGVNGEGSRYLQGPGAWGRSTAASSVTYTSIPRRISTPPPVAKTTCRLSRGGGREGEGGGCGSYCLFSDGGRGPEVGLSAGVGGGASGARAPTQPHHSPLSPSTGLWDWFLGQPQEHPNSGPEGRPALEKEAVLGSVPHSR